MNEVRCSYCKRIPFYCECHKLQEESVTKEDVNPQLLPSDVVDEILDLHRYIGYVCFEQVEKNASGVIETYWTNRVIKKSDIPGNFKSDGIQYKTKKRAMNGILKYLRL